MAARPSPPATTAGIPVPVHRVDWLVFGGAAVLAAAAIAAYGGTFAVPFHFDDVFAIADNSTIRHWSTALFPPIDTTASGRPVVNLSLAANYALSGKQVWSYHALNLAIHILAGWTLFGLVRRTLALRVSDSSASGAAFAAALLWLLHPLQTESVTYIVQRAESLMGLFYLLTLYGLIRHAEPPVARKSGRRKWAVLAVGACFLGMATKEVMVSAPLITLFYDRTFLAGSFRAAFERRWKCYLALAATWMILPFLVLSTHGRSGTAGFGSGISWWTYALTQFPAVGRYLRLSFWPHPLVFDYGTQWVAGLGSVWWSALIVTGLAGGAAWAFWQPRFNLRAIGFLGLWFFAILAPTSLVPGNRQTAAEHRMYLALIPVIVLTVTGIQRWLGRGALLVCLILAAALGRITWQRNQDYGSILALWSDTVAKNPGNPWAHNNLATALKKDPRTLGDSVAEYQEAVRLKPDYADAHDNLGSVLSQMPGRRNDALAQYEEALRLKPDFVEAHNNLGNLWLTMPERLPDAIAQYEAALRLNPDSAETHNNLGSALAKVPGREGDAIAEYQTALKLQPDFAEAHDNLGSAWAKTPGRLDDAIAEFEEAIRLRPEFVEAHYNLGVAWVDQPGRLKDAIAQYEEAIRLEPNLAKAHYNLGVAWSKMPGRSADAIAEYEAAIKLQPDIAEAHNNLGAAWANQPDRLNDAIAQLEEAVRLQPDNASFQFNLAASLLRSPTRSAEAAAHLERVLQLQPGNDTARQILAKLRAAP